MVLSPGYMADVEGQSSPACGLLPVFAKLHTVWHYRAEAVSDRPAGLSAFLQGRAKFFVTRYATRGRAYGPSDVLTWGI